MLCIKAVLVSGPTHSKYSDGQNVPAVLFADADTIEEAEVLLAPALKTNGWSHLVTERYKSVARRDEVGDSLLRDAFDEAVLSGVGYVLYPEPAA